MKMFSNKRGLIFILKSGMIQIYGNWTTGPIYDSQKVESKP